MNYLYRASYASFRGARMKTELHSKNPIKAINIVAVPVICYSYNIINWNLGEIKRIDTKIGKQLTCHRMHHQKSNIDR